MEYLFIIKASKLHQSAYNKKKKEESLKEEVEESLIYWEKKTFFKHVEWMNEWMDLVISRKGN